MIADSVRWLVWKDTKDASRPGATPPDPIPRPGVGDDKKQHKPKDSTRYDEAVKTQKFAVPRTGTAD